MDGREFARVSEVVAKAGADIFGGARVVSRGPEDGEEVRFVDVEVLAPAHTDTIERALGEAGLADNMYHPERLAGPSATLPVDAQLVCVRAFTNRHSWHIVYEDPRMSPK